MIKTVTTDRFTMDYSVFGQGDRAFVVLPGLSVRSVLLSEDDLQKAFSLMTDQYRVYIFDRRTDMPPVYHVYDMARDTAEAMEALGLRDADIFGASQGGMMAMVIAIDYPHLVHKLVLGSTSARVGEMAMTVGTEWVLKALRRDRAGLFMDFGKKLFAPETFEKIKPALEKVAEQATEEELDRFVIQTEGTGGFDELDQLPRIQCPVLVLGDETDAVLGVQATRDIAARLNAQPMPEDFTQPDAGGSKNEFYIYKDYGHAVYDTAPDYRDRIKSFLLR